MSDFFHINEIRPPARHPCPESGSLCPILNRAVRYLNVLLVARRRWDWINCDVFRRRILTRCILVPTLCLVLAAGARWAHGADWRVYDAASGLPDTACRSVTVAEDGSILAVTASSLAFCRFDGYE